jgi:hypothetical protein
MKRCDLDRGNRQSIASCMRAVKLGMRCSGWMQAEVDVKLRPVKAHLRNEGLLIKI